MVLRFANVARRAGWGVADQAFSSLTNFALAVMVARSVDTSGFGAFSLAFAMYVVLLNIARSLATEPLIIRYTGRPPREWQGAVASSTGTAVVIGAGSAVVCLVAAWVTSGLIGEAFLALAFGLPGLLLQDTWRYAFFAAGRGAAALASDVIWAVLLFPALVVLIATGHATVFWLVTVWGAAATGAGLVGVLQAAVVPAPANARRWWNEHRDIAPQYAAEFLTYGGTYNLVLYAIAGLAGVAAAGALRAGQVLLGPLFTLILGTMLFAGPEAVKLLKISPERLRTASLALAAALAVVALAWGIIAFLLPDPVGVALLGASWEPARGVLLPLTIWAAGIALTQGARLGLRALAAAGRSLRARLLGSLVLVAAASVGAAFGGVVVAAWGMAAGSCIGAAIYWWQLGRALREHEPAAAGLSSQRVASGATG